LKYKGDSSGDIVMDSTKFDKETKHAWDGWVFFTKFTAVSVIVAFVIVMGLMALLAS
jgi:hypothetical protein